MIGIFLLVLLLFLLILLSFVWPPDSPWAPKWRTSRRAARNALKLAGLKRDDKLFELGCGDGEVVISAAQDFDAQAIGIEIDPARFLITVVRVRLSGVSKKVKVLRKDFKQVNLSDATVVYMYLVPKAMERLLPKLGKELQKGTRIIAYRYKIPLNSIYKRKFVIASQDNETTVYKKSIRSQKITFLRIIFSSELYQLE